MTSEGLRPLDDDECFELLRTQTLGRVGCLHGRTMLVLPVYFAMAGHDIVFRTAPGAKLDAAILSTRVVFEVDDPEGWSVLASGRAEEVRDERALEIPMAALCDTWAPGARKRIVRIRIDHISGRRISQPRRDEA
jgi:uncharacterized protein